MWVAPLTIVIRMYVRRVGSGGEPGAVSAGAGRHGFWRRAWWLLFLSAFSWPVISVGAEAQRARDGGPDSVESLLEDGSQEHNNLLGIDLLSDWERTKQQITEDTGLSFGIDYSSQFFTAAGVPDGAFSNASAGMVRFFGKWELLNRGQVGSGTLNWKIEHRHRYGSIAPSAFSLNAGNVGVTGAPFSNQGARLTNLYWRQGLGERWVTYIGFLDATDFVDTYALASPWTGFSNLHFSTGSASMALPNDATLGAMLGGWLTDRLYVIASLGDLNSDPTNPFEGFETFFDESEFFTSVELGWTSSKDRFFMDNVHLTFWHVDDVAATGNPDGWGMNFSASYWIDDAFMPFLRGGFAEDGGSLLESSISAGVAVNLKDNRDLFGLAVNWGEPNESTFGPGLGDQVGIEAFYRLQLTQAIRITPSVQLLINPALNQEEELVPVFGLRGVVTF